MKPRIQKNMKKSQKGRVDIHTLLSPRIIGPQRGEVLTPMAVIGFTMMGTLLLSSLMSLPFIRLAAGAALALGAALAGTGGWFLYRKKAEKGRRFGFPVLFLLTAGIALLLAGGERSDFLAAQRFSDAEAVFTGAVSRVTRRADSGSSFLIRNAKIVSENGEVGTADVLFYSDGELSFDGGEIVTLGGTPSAEITLSQLGSGADLAVYRAAYLGEEGHTLLYPLYALRTQIQSAMRRHIYTALNSSDAGVTLGMLLGSREALDDRDDVLLQGAGLVHILAVSGLHIAILYSLAGLLLRPLGRRASLMLSIPLTGAYVFLTGAGVSSVRAFIMLTLLSAAELLYLPKNTSSILGTAVTFFCLTEPMCILQSGTLLSILSVWCLQISPRPRLPGSHALNEAANNALHTAFSGAAISFVTLPVMMVMTGFIPLLAPLAGVLVLPVMPAVLTLGFLVSVLGGTFIGKAVGFLLRLLLGWMRFVAAIADAGPKIPLGGELVRAGVGAVLALLILGGVICGLRQLSLHRELFTSLAVLLAAVTAFTAVCGQTFGVGAHAITLASLEGSLILEKDGAALVIGSGKNDYAGRTLAEYLRSEGVERYTLLVPEGKKSFTGGAYALSARFKPERILYAETDARLTQAIAHFPPESAQLLETASCWQLFGTVRIDIRPGKNGPAILLQVGDGTLVFTDKDDPTIYPGTALYYDATEVPPQSSPAAEIQKNEKWFSLWAEDAFPAWEAGFTCPDWKKTIQE